MNISDILLICQHVSSPNVIVRFVLLLIFMTLGTKLKLFKRKESTQNKSSKFVTHIFLI